jgi:mycothiol synthase
MGRQLIMVRPDLTDIPEAPPSSAVVRRAGESDADQLAALLSEAFEDPWTRQTLDERLLAADDVDAVFVAEIDGRIVATASSRQGPEDLPGHGCLHWVASSPAMRGQHLGAVVSIRVLRHFAEAGFSGAMLRTDDGRIPAVRTYLRLGFIPSYPDADHPARWSALFPRLLAPRAS